MNSHMYVLNVSQNRNQMQIVFVLLAQLLKMWMVTKFALEAVMKADCPANSGEYQLLFFLATLKNFFANN